MLADWYEAADAEMALHAGELDRASELAEAVAISSGKSGLLFSQGIAERVLGEVLAQCSRQTEADEHMEASIDILESGGLKLQAAWTRMRWGVRLHERGEDSQGRLLFDLAERQFAQSTCSFSLSEINRLQFRYS